MNNATLCGNVGKAPEIRTININGVELKVAVFSLATNKKRGGEKVTQWHNINIWGKLAEVVEKYVKAGDKLLLTGEILYESWDKKDGSGKGYKTTISCFSMEMLGGNPTAKQPTATAQTTSADATDELPF